MKKISPRLYPPVPSFPGSPTTYHPVISDLMRDPLARPPALGRERANWIFWESIRRAPPSCTYSYERGLQRDAHRRAGVFHSAFARFSARAPESMEISDSRGDPAGKFSTSMCEEKTRRIILPRRSSNSQVIFDTRARARAIYTAY